MSASDTIWYNVLFRTTTTSAILIALFAVLAYHSYRCYVKDIEGSPIKILQFISFKHLSFIVIIAAIVPVLEQTIMFIPQHSLPHSLCRFTIQLGMVGVATAKLALHLFVAVRSQIASGTTDIWYTMGLFLVWSDIFFIIYVVSGIPTITAEQDGPLCHVIYIPLHVYIWFAMNDFVIGTYCLLAFIVPLKKYIWLEAQQDNLPDVRKNASPEARPKHSSSELHDLAKRIMTFSGIALVSTMTVTVMASIVPKSGAVLFPLDSLINAICVVLQFKGHRIMCVPCSSVSVSSQKVKSSSSISHPATPMPSDNKITMIIHEPMPSTNQMNKPNLKDNVSLSMSLVDNDTHVSSAVHSAPDF
eukprot:200586_1